MSMYNADKVQEEDKNTSDGGSDITTKIEGNNPAALNEKQEAALESVGISPEAVPAQFTPEQTDCFVGILGVERVEEIKAGDTPTPAEFFQAKACI